MLLIIMMIMMMVDAPLKADMFWVGIEICNVRASKCLTYTAFPLCIVSR